MVDGKVKIADLEYAKRINDPSKYGIRTVCYKYGSHRDVDPAEHHPGHNVLHVYRG